MKKLFSALLATTVLLSFAACSSGGTASSSSSAAPASTPSSAAGAASQVSSSAAGKTVKVGISLALTDDFTENLRKVEEKMAGDYNLDVSFTNAGGDVSTQISNVEALIAQKPDVIVLRCIDADTGDTLVQKVHDAGIPCVVDETKPTHNTDYDVNVAGNQSVHGNLIGTYLKKYLDANPDKTLKMLYINGGTSDNIRKRMTGIFETCTNKRLVQVGDENGAWSASKAQEITEAYLTSHPDLNVIACANDEMALGVIETLKSANKLKDIMVFGVDGSTSGQASVKAGELTGTTFNDVSKAVDKIYQSCQKLGNGESITSMYTNAAVKEIDPKSYILLTKDNIDTDGTH